MPFPNLMPRGKGSLSHMLWAGGLQGNGVGRKKLRIFFSYYSPWR